VAARAFGKPSFGQCLDAPGDPPEQELPVVRPGLLAEHLDVLLLKLPDGHAAEFGDLLLNRFFHVVLLSWSRQPRVYEGSTSREYQVNIRKSRENGKPAVLNQRRERNPRKPIWRALQDGRDEHTW
jgi:hypothetical protein